MKTYKFNNPFFKGNLTIGIEQKGKNKNEVLKIDDCNKYKANTLQEIIHTKLSKEENVPIYTVEELMDELERYKRIKRVYIRFTLTPKDIEELTKHKGQYCAEVRAIGSINWYTHPDEIVIDTWCPEKYM